MPVTGASGSEIELAGSLDLCDEQAVAGWIMVVGQPAAKMRLEILQGDAIIGECVADQFRQDLRDAGIGDGAHAFRFVIPYPFPKSEVPNLRVRLKGSPLFLQAKPSGAAAVPRETVSRFGGLWVDRFDWIDKLAMKHRQGAISDDLASRIFRFVRDGYVVIEGAVPADLAEDVNAEIERFWRDPPAGLLIETFEPDSQRKQIPPDLRYRDGRTKLLDAYAFSAVAREACAAPKVLEFLRAIFEDMPKAFQGLTFWKGSQQAIHKDTAYVKVDNPLHLAATWLALEDIKPGSGELEYFVGSHRSPDFVFAGASKWLDAAPKQHDEFLKSLHTDAAKFSQTKSSFLGKRGDVLVWHADLAHGGAPIARPDATRKSMVTHFTAADDDPFYLRSAPRAALVEKGCAFISAGVDMLPRP